MQEQNGVEGVIENWEWRVDVVIDHYSSFPIYIAGRDDLIPLFPK